MRLRDLITGICVVVLCQFVLLAPGSARADSVAISSGGRVAGTIKVVRNGKTKRDASEIVVYVVGFKQPPPKTVPALAQRSRQFVPRVLPITSGQKVDFPNFDKFFHNVFSLSKARKFDLGQYKAGKSKRKTFPRKGIVEVYCNIHPDMTATILVLPNRAFAVTDSAGKFQISGIPPGQHTAFAYSRRAVRPVRAKITVADDRTTTLNLTIVEDKKPAAHRNKYGEAYKDKNAKY